jgi:RecA/RadA recombinase
VCSLRVSLLLPGLMPVPHCTLPTHAAGKVAYIDTEGTFRPDRVRQIAQAVGLEADSVLENIAVARAHNHEHQSGRLGLPLLGRARCLCHSPSDLTGGWRVHAELLVTVAALMADDVYKLLIMDGLMSHYRVDFVGEGMHSCPAPQGLGTSHSHWTESSEPATCSDSPEANGRASASANRARAPPPHHHPQAAVSCRSASRSST